MHRYMRAIGFSKLTDRRDQQRLVTDVIMNATDRSYTSNGSENKITAEFCRDFAPGLGLAVCGEFDGEDHYTYDYFFPYLRGNIISSTEDVTVERHAEKESYAGICDDIKVGVSLIFYLQNMIPYIRIMNQGLLPVRGTTLSLSGLSVQGTILFPIEKTENDKRKVSRMIAKRSKLINAARLGDEEAIEHLTLEDMDTYTSLSKLIVQQDVFSLVDTYFMPYGVECDHYNLMGEIVALNQVKNELTDETVWKMTISCNDLLIDICINTQDLYGEPAIGRRFKGVIWLQGYINYPGQ